MPQNKVIERTCAGCGKKGKKEDFIRFVIFNDKPLLDIKGTLPGRGFNVCPNAKCIKRLIKKHFKGKINPDFILEKTEKQLKKQALSLISIAHKSHKTVLGQDNIIKLTGKGTLILAKDLSERTKRNLKNRADTTFNNIFSKNEIGSAVKKESSIGVLHIKSSGIEKKIGTILKKLQSLIQIS